jgi:large subunit ribosomal protein L23
MADITDIKSIVYTEKVLGLNDENTIVIKTSPRMTKNAIKEVFREYFGVSVVRVNSLRQSGKAKRFRGVQGKRDDFKKFYVKVPEGTTIESLAV